MRNSQNHKKHVNYFFNGADYDIHPDIASAKQGFYKDAKNMRINTGSENVKRIDGETLKYYSKIKGYSCIGSIEVNGNVVEIWVSDNTNETLGVLGTVIFRINGVVMVQTTTDKLKFIRTRKLQMDKADDCTEGLFFMTDNFDVPYMFSLKDIIDNYSPLTTKYFADFNKNLYSLNLNNYQDIPVFRQLTTNGTLLVGKYAYAIRFVDKDGNKTKFGIPTPMIPVPLNYEKGSNAHPYNSTHGGYVGATSPYGIKLQFRINNILNYQYIEILRIKSIADQAFNEVQEAEYRPLTPELSDGEVSVRTFIDDGSYDDWIVFVDDESTDTLSAIERVKCVRYFNNQLVLSNVKLASRDITESVQFHTYYGETAFPFIDNLGEKGYYSPYNSAYKTSYMSGERYGLGVLCLDSQNNNAFVVPVINGTADFTNYKFPERREQVSGATFDLSYNNWKGIPKAADIDNDDNGGIGHFVHEKFSKSNVNKLIANRTIKDSAYNPYTPKYYDDTDVSGLDEQPNKAVSTIAKNVLLTNQIPSANIYPYSPNFSIDYYGMGIAIAGIESLPDWVTAFCIVRTKPAGRVVCQGISAYQFIDSPQSKNSIKSSGIYNSVKKDLTSISFFSDDLNAGYIGAYTENKFIQNKFKPVSPLGYFSEVYQGQKDYLGVIGDRMYDKGIDVILYARELVTDVNYGTSPYLFDVANNTKYWTKFGKWRNSDSDLFSGSSTEFGISSDDNYTFKNVGLDNYLKITLDSAIYKNESPAGMTAAYGAELNCNDTFTKKWHEPFYIANIIDDNKIVPDVNQQEYVLTGHYQKIKSMIGKGNDQEQSIPLVDERFEDCCVNLYNAIRPAYIYIKDVITGEEKAWVDITIYSSSVANYDQTVITALQTNGYYDSTDPVTGDVVRCYGAYKHTYGTSIVAEGDWTIQFSEIPGLDKEYCIPSNNCEIIVNYDKRFPMKVFGGDVTIGESIFNLVDGLSDSNGNVSNNNQLFAWVGFPYSAYDINQQIYNAGNSASYQEGDFIISNIYRQIAVSSIVESRVHLPYSTQSKSSNYYESYNNFPRVHYIIRPIRWNTSSITTSNFGIEKVTFR